MDEAKQHVGVLVVGAGLAGLTAGAEAGRLGADVAVLDVRSPGGRARSDSKAGYIFNQGPHALYRKGPGVEILAGLGIHPAGVPPATAVAAWNRGKLVVLPISAGSLLRTPLVGWRSKAALARLLATFARLDAGSLAMHTAEGWVQSLSLRDDAAAVLRALLRVASYAPDLDAISADAAVRQLQLVQTGGVSYLHGGWSVLVSGLTEAITVSGGRVVPGERAVRIAPVEQPEGTSRWEVQTSGGTRIAQTVVIAAGSPAATRSLLPSEPAWHLGNEATAACLDLGLRQPPSTLAAFGIDQPLYLSTHAPSAELCPSGGAVVHVMRYGARSSEEDRSDLWRLAAATGIRQEDVVTERFLHRMTVTQSLPLPGTGLRGRPTTAVNGWPGLFIAGDWVGPVGLLADAAISSGYAAGQAAAAIATRNHA
jgi:phytoene dehydrogenase-like protein